MTTNNELIDLILEEAKNSVWERAQVLKKELTEKEYWQLCVEMAPHSFLAFCQAIKKRSFIVKHFHKVIAAVFEHVALNKDAPKRVILAAPPRSGKSMLTQLYVCWLCGLNEQTAHIFSSYGQRLSTKFMAKIALIMQSPEYMACFPNFCGFQLGSKTEFKTGGSIFATSVGGAITGFDAGSLDPLEIITERINQGALFGTAPGVGVVDDPLKSGESEAIVENLEAWWVDEFNSRRTNYWAQLLIATRFHVNDLHALVLNMDGEWSSTNPTGWLYLNLKALRGPLSEYDPLHRDNEDDAIWGDDHATLNKKELIKLRSKNTYRFNTLYQGEPSVAEGNIVKQDDIPHTPLDFIPKVHNLTLSIDAASGITSTCDNTTLTIGGTTEEDKPIVIQQNSGNWDIIKLRTKIREINKSYDFDSVVIEASSNGLVLLPEITADPMSYGFQPHCNIIKASPQLYGSKARRLESVLDLVKMSLFCNFEEYDLFKSELIAFPYGTKDDRVDSYSWLLWHLRPFCKEAEEGLKAEYTKLAIEAFKIPLIDSKISDLIAKPVWEKDYSFARYGQPIR